MDFLVEEIDQDLTPIEIPPNRPPFTHIDSPFCPCGPLWLVDLTGKFYLRHWMEN